MQIQYVQNMMESLTLNVGNTKRTNLCITSNQTNEHKSEKLSNSNHNTSHCKAHADCFLSDVGNVVTTSVRQEGTTDMV